MRRRNYYGNTIVAAKKYHGVTVGYMVGWKALYGDGVRNIRENLFFDTPEKALEFRDALESMRIDVHPTFEILD